MVIGGHQIVVTLWVAGDFLISGDQCGAGEAGGGGDEAVGGVAVELVGEAVGLLDDCEVKVMAVPAVEVEAAIEPGFPMIVDENAPAFGEAGDFGGADCRHADLAIRVGEDLFGLRRE